MQKSILDPRYWMLDPRYWMLDPRENRVSSIELASIAHFTGKKQLKTL